MIALEKKKDDSWLRLSSFFLSLSLSLLFFLSLSLSLSLSLFFFFLSRTSVSAKTVCSCQMFRFRANSDLSENRDTICFCMPETAIKFFCFAVSKFHALKTCK